MKLTLQQIQSIETALGKAGVAYADIRYEMADHIAILLEEKGGNFEDELAEYIKVNKKHLKKLNRKMFFMAALGAYRKLGQTLVSPGFLAGLALLTLSAVLLSTRVEQELLIRVLFFIFCIAGGGSSYLFLYRIFRYRRQYSGGVGFSFLTLVLLYLGIFMMDWRHYIGSTILIMLYYSFSVVCAAGMYITAERQYRQYKLKYEG